MLSILFSEFVAGDFDDDAENHQLYVVKAGNEVLYIGITNDLIWNRWFSQGSSHMQIANGLLKGYSTVGRAIEDNLPESLGWTIAMYTLEDCIRILENDIKQGPWKNVDIRLVENLMIQKMSPSLNVIGNWRP